MPVRFAGLFAGKELPSRRVLEVWVYFPHGWAVWISNQRGSNNDGDRESKEGRTVGKRQCHVTDVLLFAFP